MPLRNREYFLNSIIFELLEDYWLFCKQYRDNVNAKYYFG